jgi:hypothetical protein
VGSDLLLFCKEGLTDKVPVVQSNFGDFINELLLFLSDFSFCIAVPMVVEEHNILS